MLMLGLSIAIISLCLAVAFGVGRPGTSFDLSRALLGIGLVPTFIAVVVWASFALVMPLLPSPLLLQAMPALAALIVAALRHQRVRWPLTAGLTLGYLVLGAITIAALSPFLTFVLAIARSNYTAHDISIYLMEAGGLANRMTSGAVGWLDWFTYRHPDVTHPHSPAYSFYLAWGFLFAGGTGPAFDLLPKLLVGFSFIATGAAAAGLLSRRSNLYWGLLGILVLFTNPLWNNEVQGLSREGFYTAPLLVLTGLLLRSYPEHIRQQAWLLSGQALALAGTLLGHSLGLIYASAAIAGCGLVWLMRYGRRTLILPSSWLMAVLLAVGAAATLSRYFIGGAAQLGFSYASYVDPFHLKLIQSGENGIVVAPSLWTLVDHLMRTNGVSWLHLVPIAPAAVLILYITRRRRLPFATTWIALSAATTMTLLVVWALPVRLEGASLAAAFVRNFRYGLPLGSVVALLTVGSGAVIYLAMRTLLPWRWPRRMLGTLLFGSLALAASGNALLRNPSSIAAIFDRLAGGLEGSCDIAKAVEPRRIFIDNDLLFYDCEVPSTYAFTPRGAAIAGADGAATAAALDADQIDAVILTLAPQWWEGARLYHFLIGSPDWQHTVDEVSRVEVFVRLL